MSLQIGAAYCRSLLVKGAQISQNRVCEMAMNSQRECHWVLWVQATVPASVAGDWNLVGSVSEQLAADVQSLVEQEEVIIVSIVASSLGRLVNSCPEVAYAVVGKEAQKEVAARAWGASAFNPCQ
jgi:hypothetical protein